ncbi:tRNA (guanosine(37)-N1)-methyltransferase TrmD [Candidatus Parcubacteria bacterium]|nr:MAG: tRNA (guanosine(37)-N1)-methyltransferase TrmD [Candidatus Parcubacteria bacterium]
MLHFHIITLFPEAIEPYLKSSILGRAQKDKKVKISFYDPKKFTRDKYGRVDRRPYGGGPGMVLEPDAMLRAAEKAVGKKRSANIFFSTDGEQFSEILAKKFSKQKDILLICGHYEGVDERVASILKAKKISMGPFVLTGGELPAAALIDAVSRFVPGVLGKAESLERSRVSSPKVYTRPEVLAWKGKKYRVPKVLLSGHHANIDAWKIGKKGGKTSK